MYAICLAIAYKNTAIRHLPSVDHASDETSFHILFCLSLNIYQTNKSVIKSVCFHLSYSSRHNSSWRCIVTDNVIAFWNEMCKQRKSTYVFISILLSYVLQFED